MKFETAYGRMQTDIRPNEALVRKTLTAAAKSQRPARRWKRLVAIAAALALLVATPVLAAGVEPVYQLMYQLAPAVAQFFQPVQESDTDNGIRMEVMGVSVAGDTAQAYITLQDLEGDRVDATTDLYDSWSLRVPFDSIGHCERLGFDEETKTATFLVTSQTMGGEAVPSGKQSFSLNCFLSQKETLHDLPVDLSLANYAAEASTTDRFQSSGGGGLAYDTYGENAPMLLPHAPLSTPMAELPITAAGYADGLFHVQVQLLDYLKTNSHCTLRLKTAGGEVIDTLASVYFTDYAEENRTTYVDFLFDISPEALTDCTLYGDFYTFELYTDGNWRVTFPLESH